MTRLHARILSTVALLVAAVLALGVAPLRARAWPLQVVPQPTKQLSLVSMTSTGSGGGTSVIGATSVETAARPTVTATIGASGAELGLVVTSWTATTINVTVPASTAGTYTVCASNPGGGKDCTPGLLRVLSTTTPQTLFTTHLRAQYVCDDAVVDADGSANVNSQPDATSYGNSATQSTDAAKLVKTLNDPDCNGHASCLLDGSNDYLEKTSFSFGSSTTYFVYGAIKVTGTNGSHAQTIIEYSAGDSYVRVPISATYLELGKSGTAAQFTSVAITGTGANFLAGFVGGSTEYAQVNNITAVTTSITGNPSNSGTLDIGQRSGSDFGGYKYCELGVLDLQPSPTDATTLVQYLNGQYATVASPTITATTNIGASTSTGFRVLGTGFQPGLTGTVTIAGTPTTLTATQIDATHAEFSGFPSTPAATVNTFVLANADTRSISYDTLPIVSTSTDPMASEGLSCSAWYGGSAVKAGGGTPSTGDKVQTWTDLSYGANDAPQATGANQGTWSTSDSNFSGAPSLTADGSTTKYQVAALRFSTVSQLWVMGVCRQASTTGSQAPWRGSGDVYESTSSGTPRGAKGGTFVSWTGSVSGTHELLARHDGSSTLGIQVDNSGSEQTTSVAASITNNQAFDVFNRGSANFWNGSCATIAVFTSPPSASRMHTYAQTLGAPCITSVTAWGWIGVLCAFACAGGAWAEWRSRRAENDNVVAEKEAA